MSQQKTEIGTLVVVVLKAQHLHQPSFYKQDPYAQVSFSGLKKQTKVDPKGGQHPVWDDELRFPVLADTGKDKVNRIVEISCYKDEQRGDDILLGKGMVNVEETLKTGEFDDWVPLETSAGARGEVYLEMTFYANAPPPLTRRPSKLSPSDRLARPAAYFKQGQQLSPTSTSPPTPSGRFPVPGERKPSQLSSIGASQIPLSLIPAHGSQSLASKQTPSSQSTASMVATKQKDKLPPLPANDPTDVDSGEKLGVPATLHPGGRSGPKPMLPQNRNRVGSVGLPSAEALPHERHRAVSDTPVLAPSFSRMQAPMQAYSPEITPITGPRIGSTPSIVVEQHEDRPPLAYSTTFATSPGHSQEHEPRGIYATGDFDSLTYRPPDQAYLQPQDYTSCLAQSYLRTISPSQHPVPLQSSRTPLGQPRQPHNTSPAIISPPSPYQQYTLVPGGSPTPQPPPPPQLYSQPRSNQPQHVPYPPQVQQNPPLSQQPYMPPPSPQYHLQHLPYSQTPHLPTVLQSYQQPDHPGLLASSQPSVAARQQQPPYSQTPRQLYLTAPPPPPPVQSQTPEPYAPQLSLRQPQSFVPPPPPPPPPHNQGGKIISNPVSVTQPLQTSAPPSAPSQGPVLPPVSLPPSVTPATPLLQPSTTLPSQAVANIAPASSTEEVVTRKQVEERENTTKPASAGEGEEVRGCLEAVVRNQEDEEQGNRIVQGGAGQPPNDMEEQGVHEESERKQRLEEKDRRREEEVRGEEELREQENWNRQEAERRWEGEEQRKRKEEERQRVDGEERRKQQEEFERREEECRKKEEEEYFKREEEERKRREEEERRKEEKERREIEEEERRKREEERTRQEQAQKRREEEERKREEEERRKREEERRRQEEERIRREREEEERRRIATEEARRRRAEETEAERRWQAELVRIRARAEQEAADAAYARAQIEAEEAERQRQEEADLALVRQVQEEAEREERLAQERRRQEEADREVARREQAHEEELERRREEETRRRMEEADRELARRLDMELNLGADYSGDQSRQRTSRSERH